MNVPSQDITPAPLETMSTPAPRLAGSRIDRSLWSNRETAILLDNWPFNAVTGAKLLPNRTPSAILAKCYRHKLKVPQNTPFFPTPRREPSNQFIDDAICRCCERGPLPGELAKLAHTIMRHRGWVQRRAVQLGFVRPRTMPRWSDEEVELIRSMPSASSRVIRGQLLRQFGMQRSETAIVQKMRFLRIDRSDPNSFTLQDVSTLMGISHSIVGGWIKDGLVATHGMNRAHWKITKSALRAWIVANPIRINLRKITDQVWFIDLLSGPADNRFRSYHQSSESKPDVDVEPEG